MTKRRLLPEGMLRRWPAMIVWLIATGFTTLDAPEFMATTITFALLGVAIALLLTLMWGKRTRPRKGGLWVLLHILLLAAVVVLVEARPIMALVAAIPVALVWVHDAPSSPTAMLTWGVILLLWQPAVWESAGEDTAWNVALAVILMIAAAQMERNRLAKRQFAQAGPLFSILRIGAVAVLSMGFVAGREGLRAVNVFQAMGMDLSGFAGKITMLAIIALSLTIAIALWRIRPEKAPRTVPEKVEVVKDPKRAVDPRQGKLDFDDAPRKAPKTRLERQMDARKPGAKPAPKPAKPVARPGELDFD